VTIKKKSLKGKNKNVWRFRFRNLLIIPNGSVYIDLPTLLSKYYERGHNTKSYHGTQHYLIPNDLSPGYTIKKAMDGELADRI
jgi:hypothetical protein